MRGESLACYAHPLIGTPNDRLAAEGARFDQCQWDHVIRVASVSLGRKLFRKVPTAEDREPVQSDVALERFVNFVGCQ